MIESAPDTILVFQDGARMPVLEAPEIICKKIIEFKSAIMSEQQGSASWNSPSSSA